MSTPDGWNVYWERGAQADFDQADFDRARKPGDELADELADDVLIADVDRHQAYLSLQQGRPERAVSIAAASLTRRVAPQAGRIPSVAQEPTARSPDRHRGFPAVQISRRWRFDVVGRSVPWGFGASQLATGRPLLVRGAVRTPLASR